MIRRAGFRLLFAVVFAAIAGGCSFRPSRVTRVADGVPYEGRFISPEAYAAYGRGAALEARGELATALEVYEDAVAEDSASPELWTRIGAIRCRYARAAGDAWERRADLAFARAREQDDELAPLWAEIARCRARTRRSAEALAAAERAARLDPDWVEAQLLVVELADASGKRELAAAWLDALVARSPESRLAWRALLQFATRHADAGRRLRAEAVLAPATPRERGAALDLALRAGDLERARALAPALGRRAADVALRAVELGALELAEAQAELVLGADPEDANAWVAALVAADLAGDHERFESRLRAAPREPAGPISAPARRLLDALLSRRTGVAPGE